MFHNTTITQDWVIYTQHGFIFHNFEDPEAQDLDYLRIGVWGSPFCHEMTLMLHPHVIDAKTDLQDPFKRVYLLSY